MEKTIEIELIKKLYNHIRDTTEPGARTDEEYNLLGSLVDYAISKHKVSIRGMVTNEQTTEKTS